MKRKKWTWITAGLIVLALAVVTFFWGGSQPAGHRSELTASPAPSATAPPLGTAPPLETAPPLKTEEPSSSQEPDAKDAEPPQPSQGTQDTEEMDGKKTPSPSPAPSATAPPLGTAPPPGTAPPLESEQPSVPPTPSPQGTLPPQSSQDTQGTQDIADGEKEYTCTLSVRCDTILDNLDKLDLKKKDLVPSDGVIFPETQVAFYEGESVFNVLQRELRKAKIHMEFVSTPVYDSAYIEGIGNLYEFDCGELSGWNYKVNGWAPNYGCSRYTLRDGDVVEWVYTCDLGRDVGAEVTEREDGE